MSFEQQANRAKALTRGYRANYKFNKAVGRDVDLFGNAYYDYQLKRGFDAAYGSKEGYSVLKNPVSGEDEMFVRGTAKPREWLQNAVEAIPRGVGAVAPGLSTLSKYSLYRRGQFAKKIGHVAERRGVSVSYGHSRGAAVVGDMTFRGKKVGVDGAMLLNKRKGAFVNYRQWQPFDWVIGRRGGREVVRRGSWNPRSRGFHKAYVW